MDLHRCRFVPYPPSAINAIAVPYQESSAQCTAHNANSTRVAVGRASGNVEIWNPANGMWIHEVTMYGGQNRSIDGLAWVADGKRLRLFSIGGSSAVTEWDIERARPKRHAQGQHGEIWCMAAQPPRQSKSSEPPKLVVGTVDGELATYTLEDGGLQFERKVLSPPKKKKKAATNIVSLAFQHPDIVLAGCSDSSIYVCDVRRGIQLRTLSLGADSATGAKDIIVWAIKTNPTTHGFVTGDSTGTVCIWNHKTYTITQKIQAHEQDVLSLAISLDGHSIMSGGMDRRAVLIRKHSVHDRYGKVWGRKYHDHDVKALASLEMSSGMSVCISGGWWSRPATMRELLADNARPRRIPGRDPAAGTRKRGTPDTAQLAPDRPHHQCARGALRH
jgi:U3 small nucleolar RNA-associated protein 4